jgi:hypothetical protein
MGIRDEKMEDFKSTIKGSFIQGTSHLKKSRARGNDARSRDSKNKRLLLILIILAVLFWHFFLR